MENARRKLQARKELLEDTDSLKVTRMMSPTNLAKFKFYNYCTTILART